MPLEVFDEYEKFLQTIDLEDLETVSTGHFNCDCLRQNGKIQIKQLFWITETFTDGTNH